ncbi:MAG: response regulator [Candidatus Aminicenantes bacterium]|nr:response regulator [Candidatus Aminicenantes bacterium]
MAQKTPFEAGSEAGSRRVLIVEDEFLLARDISYMLRDLGCHVVGIAATAEDAIDQAGAALPHLVLMDIRLKGQRDGIEAAGEIRRRYGLPLVFVTAQSDEAILEKARSTRPIGILFKPFSENDLERMLREAGFGASGSGC